MFDIGWSEMAVILLVALVVIGPRDLPRVARTMGQWVAKGRAMAREFQTALEDMAREAELDKVKSEIEKAGRTNLGKTIENTIDPTGELGKAFDPNAKDGAARAKDTAAKPAIAKPAAAKLPREPPAEPAAAKPPRAEPPAEPRRQACGRQGRAGRRQGGAHEAAPSAAAGNAGPAAGRQEKAPAAAAGPKRPSARPCRPIQARWR